MRSARPKGLREGTLPIVYKKDDHARMKFDRVIATRLPDDLADQLEREAADNLEPVSCRLRKLIAELYRGHSASVQQEAQA